MVTAARAWWSGLGRAARRELLIATLLLFAYGFFRQQPAWNEYSRYDLVRAIVDQGTLRIDAFHENTGDKAFFDGHWYSDKPPGTALLGVPVYAVLSLASRLTGAGTPSEVDAVQALAFVECALPTVLLVLLLMRFLRPRVGERAALGVGLAYGFGSIAFPFATMFFGHASSTAALFASFFLLHRAKERPDRSRAVLAGFLAGWAVLIEIPVVIGVAALLVYAFFVGRGTVLRFVVGGVPLALVLMAYDWAAFGDPFSIGYQHATVFGQQNAQGLVSIVWPSLDRAWELLFSERGLLRLAPWFALAPLGLVALRRPGLRFEIVLAVVVCAAFLTYNSGALNPFGGWTPGPRYLMPALPFAALLVGLMPRRAWLLAIPLMVVSAGVFLIATATMPNAPERYIDPLFELWMPRFLAGGLADSIAWLRWGLPGIVPLAVLLLSLTFGLVAAALSLGGGALADRTALRAPVALGVLAIVFSLPFPPPTPVALGSAATGPVIAIVSLGHARTVADGVEEVELWAQLENRGAAVSGVRTELTIWEVGGGAWSAWYGDVTIAAGSRHTVRFTWHPEDPAPGDHRFGFSVRDEASGSEYAGAVAPQPITVGD